MECSACDDATQLILLAPLLHENGLDADLVTQIFANLRFSDLLACSSTCKRWQRLLRDTEYDEPWRSAFARTWPAAAGFEKPASTAYRQLGRRMAEVPPSHGLMDVQFAVTVTMNGTTSSPESRGPRYLSAPATVAFAQTLDYATSRPVTHAMTSVDAVGTGFEWDVTLPLPKSYPTECAPDGRSVVILTDEILVDAYWREADKRYEVDECSSELAEPAPPLRADTVGPQPSTGGPLPRMRSRFLTLEVVAFRKRDGKILKLTPPRRPLGLLMRHRLERLPYELRDGLYFRDHLVNSTYYLAARLRPKAPLPLGEPVLKTTRLAWSLSLELCRAADGAIAYESDETPPWEDVRHEAHARDDSLGFDDAALGQVFFAGIGEHFEWE